MNALFTVHISDDTSNKIEILRMKKISMYNLFTSYMNDYFEVFSDFKLNSFIDEYSLICLEYDHLINSELAKQISSEDLAVITSPCKKYCISFNYLKKEIVVIDKSYCINENGGNNE